MGQIMIVGIKIFIKLDFFQNYSTLDLNISSTTLVVLNYNNTSLVRQGDFLSINLVYLPILLKDLMEFIKLMMDLAKLYRINNG